MLAILVLSVIFVAVLGLAAAYVYLIFKIILIAGAVVIACILMVVLIGASIEPWFGLVLFASLATLMWISYVALTATKDLPPTDTKDLPQTGIQSPATAEMLKLSSIRRWAANTHGGSKLIITKRNRTATNQLCDFDEQERLIFIHASVTDSTHRLIATNEWAAGEISAELRQMLKLNNLCEINLR